MSEYLRFLKSIRLFNMKIFSGTSNPQLSQSIASALSAELGKVEITRFIDNECRVFIDEDVSGQDVVIIQSLSMIADQHLVELCLLGQAAKDLGAKKVIAVIPWMGYSKQDKAFRKGEAISAQLVAKFIEAAGFDSVITVELHSENVIPYFHIPVTELSSHTLLVDALKKQSTISLEHACVASPDRGGKNRSEVFAKEAHLSMIYLDKTRNYETGSVSITGNSADVSEKDIVIFDDIINTGATSIEAARYLKEQGAKHVYMLATHAVLAGSAVTDLEESCIDYVFVTDSIGVPQSKKIDRMSIISLAPILAVAISASIR